MHNVQSEKGGGRVSKCHLLQSRSTSRYKAMHCHCPLLDTDGANSARICFSLYEFSLPVAAHARPDLRISLSRGACHFLIELATQELLFILLKVRFFAVSGLSAQTVRVTFVHFRDHMNGTFSLYRVGKSYPSAAELQFSPLLVKPTLEPFMITRAIPVRAEEMVSHSPRQ